MGMIDAVSFAGSLKIKPIIMQYATSDYDINKKQNSIRVEIPRKNDVRKFRCCFSNHGTKESFIESYKSIIPNIEKRYNEFWSIFSNFDHQQWYDTLTKYKFDNLFRHSLCLMFVVDDEHGQLMQTIDDLVAKEDYLSDNRKRVNIVLDEVLPLLLENSDRWITTDLMACKGTPGFTFLKPENRFCLLPSASDIRDAPKRSSRSRRCTKVFVDLALIDKVDRKYNKFFGKVRDFKGLLRHLMARDGIFVKYFKHPPICFELALFNAVLT